MNPSVFLKGLIFGLSIAAPVGPMAVLCIRRTLAFGRVLGLVTGLGVASADAFYGAIAAFGLTFVSSFLVGQAFWIRLIGGGFLCYLGVKTLLSQPAERAAATSTKNGNFFSIYFSTFLLTLTNPLTILSFAAVFAGLGVNSSDGDYLAAAVVVVGVFTGSGLWWVILTSGISLFRAKFNEPALLWVNRISGLIILAFGLLNIANLLF